VKVLVLGGSSFSGRAFCRHAAFCGVDVLNLSRPNYDLLRNMPDAAAELVREGYDNVVNFVALNVVDASWDREAEYYETNVVGTARLAKRLMAAGVKRFLNVSTPEVYGNTGTLISEGAPFNPSTPYALSRATADAHLTLMHCQHGFPVMFTRTVNVYGPGQQPYRIIPRTIECIRAGRRLPLEGGGASSRSFIHIQDAASAYLRVLESGRAGETYHVSTGRQTRIRDLVEAICERMGARLSDVIEIVPERRGKDMNYHLHDSKIRGELGWRDHIPLEDGLAQVIAWHREAVAA
jgi:dTDP-glucose 4,6-dehydratase